MLKRLTRVSLFVAPVALFALPLSAAMLPGAKTEKSQSAGTLVEQVATKKRRPPPGPDACARESVSETGAQRPTINLARASAERNWRQKVRFKHGELYIDVANAKDVTWRCSKSSIAIGLKRCELIARPCRAPSS
ncbi:MAG: hypothetical protein AB7K67_01170 [Hyphomicrobiaceae bacterium]